jgi:hypothetical protein
VATGVATALFFTDHGTNSGNTVLTFCAEQIGMNARQLRAADGCDRPGH